MPTLGERLAETASTLLDLQKQTKSPAKKQRIAGQLKELLDLAGRLVDANVSTATNEYKEATTGLQQATSAIKKAMKDLAKVADAIDKIAKALDFLVKVAKLAGV